MSSWSIITWDIPVIETDRSLIDNDLEGSQDMFPDRSLISKLIQIMANTHMAWLRGLFVVASHIAVE